MIGIKSYLRKKTGKLILPHISPDSFPQKPLTKLQVWIIIRKFEKELKLFTNSVGTGSLLVKPNNIAVKTLQKLLPYISNNLGNWSTGEQKPFNLTTKLEQEVINKMINLFAKNRNNLEGYITSGATEGNIFSAWIGRNYLQKYTKTDKICLLRNDLTHYSIRKAANIVGLRDFLLPINDQNWNSDILSLLKTLEKLFQKGYRGFLVPITLGYTVGGTSDDIAGILNKVRLFKKFHPGVYFFIWIDAALSGMMLPFISESFLPFDYPEISTFIADFHKFSGVPYPAGLILYRKKLRQHIEKKIPYLEAKDNTLLGSRTGLAAASIWNTLHFYAYLGFKKEAIKCIARKNDFIKKLYNTFSGINIITDDKSPAAAIIVKKKLPEDFCLKHDLEMIKYNITFVRTTKTVKLYKLFFLPKYS